MTRPAPTRLLLVPLLAGALVLGACSSDGSDGAGDATTTEATGPAAGTGDVLAGLADDVIVPAYDQLATDLAAFGTAVDGLCATPTADAVAAAQDGWRTAVTTWQASRPNAVGPAMDLRLMSSVGFEARPASIAKLLEGTDPVDSKALANEGAAVRGLYAAEDALFGEGADALASADGARRCEYLASVVGLTVIAADEVAAEWDGAYRDTFVDGIDGDLQASVGELVNEVVHRLQELDEKGLRDLAAADELGDLNDNRLDAAGAYAMAGRKALLGGIAALLGEGDAGIVGLVAARSGDTGERLQAATEEAVAALDALPDSVEGSFPLDDEVQAASDAVAALKVLLSTEAASQLGVTISFSDADGDS